MKRILLGVVILSLALTAGCAKKEARQIETLSLGLVKDVDFNYIIASKKGYFKEEGLEVTAKECKTGLISFEKMLNADVDIGISAPTSLSLYFERKDFKIIFSSIKFRDFYKVIARKDKGINKPADLRSKRVATQSKESAMNYFLYEFLLRNGLSPEDIQPSFMPVEELPAALASGAIDAFASKYTYVDEAKKLLGNNAIIFSEPNATPLMIILTAKDSFIKAKPEAIKRTLKAYLRAEDFMKKHPDEAIRIIVEELQIPESQIRELWRNVDFNISLNHEIILTLEDHSRWAIKNKIVDKTDVPNALDYIYTDALDEIAPERVKIIR